VFEQEALFSFNGEEIEFKHKISMNELIPSDQAKCDQDCGRKHHSLNIMSMPTMESALY